MLKRKRMTSCLCAIALALPATALADAPEPNQEGAQQQRSSQEQEQANQTRDQEQPAAQGSAQQQQQQQQQANQGSEQSPQRGLMSLSYSEIKRVQQELQQQGHYTGNIDGMVGPKTRAALENFKEQNQIADDVSFGATMHALGLGTGSERQNVSGSDEQRAQPGSQTERQNVSGQDRTIQLSSLDQAQVRDLQMQLQERGFYQGQLDGVVGPKTLSALQRYFEKQAQLAARGELGEAALVDFFGVEPSEIQRTSGSDAQDSSASPRPQDAPDAHWRPETSEPRAPDSSIPERHQGLEHDRPGSDSNVDLELQERPDYE